MSRDLIVVDNKMANAILDRVDQKQKLMIQVLEEIKQEITDMFGSFDALDEDFPQPHLDPLEINDLPEEPHEHDDPPF